MFPVSAVALPINRQSLLPQIKKDAHWGPVGWILSMMGESFKVYDEGGQTHFYVSKKGLVRAIAGVQESAVLRSERVRERVLEVLNPVVGESIKLSKIIQMAKEIDPGIGENLLIQKLEGIRDRHLPQASLDIEKLKQTLKPGDLIFKKNHEDNPNIICRMQKLFKALIWGNKEREGHKYSHVAMYVGNGEVAEAVGPHGKDPQVRVLRLDDPRFALMAKNEFRVTRPSDEKLGLKAAQVFRSFSRPIIPDLDNPLQKRIKSLKYNFIEAARSLWHSSSFGYFARQRYLKYHADYTDGKMPTQAILPRRLFCSYAVSLAYQVADSLVDRKEGPRNLKEIVGEPPTNIRNQYLRMIVRAIWSRFHAIIHWKRIEDFVQIKYDAVRSNPQDMRNFVLRNPTIFRDHLIIK